MLIRAEAEATHAADADKAEKTLTDGLLFDRSHVGLFKRRALLYHDTGRADLALADLMECTSMVGGQDDLQAWALLVRVQVARGNAHAARDAVENALRKAGEQQDQLAAGGGDNIAGSAARSSLSLAKAELEELARQVGGLIEPKPKL
jgi:Tfp pilus assembly protein PilF